MRNEKGHVVTKDPKPLHESVMDRCLDCAHAEMRGELIYCVPHHKYTRTDPFCNDHKTRENADTSVNLTQTS